MSRPTRGCIRSASRTPSLDAVASTIIVGDPNAWQPLADRYTDDARKRFYLYNAHRPASGSSATEDDGVAMRELAWGQYKKRINRWFIWESTYYNDFQGGRGETNVFQNAQTFGGTPQGDANLGQTGWNYANGDGVLFYPGTDWLFPADSYGVKGPFASLRLKYWRRGIQDVDYLTLASAIDPAQVQAIVEATVPKVLWEYGVSDPNDPTWVRTAIRWSADPDAWEAARRRLADIITGSGGGTGGGGPSPTRIEERDAAVVKGPGQWDWGSGTDGRASGGTYIASAGAGSTVRVTFTGTGIKWIGIADSCSGQASVDVDGISQTVDGYRSTGGGWQQVLYAIAGLPATSHTLTLTVLGTKDPASCGAWIYVDSFDIQP